MEDFVEMRLLGAVRKMLIGRVNEILHEFEFAVPFIEFGDYSGEGVVVPVIGLVSCEGSEKERIVRVEAYSLSISFALPDTPESELVCYALGAAVERVIREDLTLGGVADRAVLTGKKYVPPKAANCGGKWEVILTLRITIEGIGNAG